MIVSTLIMTVALLGQSPTYDRSGGGLYAGGYVTGLRQARVIQEMQVAAYQGSLQAQNDAYWAAIQQRNSAQARQAAVAPWVLGPNGWPLQGPNGQISGYWNTSN